MNEKKRKRKKVQREKVNMSNDSSKNLIHAFLQSQHAAVVITKRLTIMRHFKWKSYCEITVNCVLRHNVIVINARMTALQFLISTSCHIIIIFKSFHSLLSCSPVLYLPQPVYFSPFQVFYVIFLPSFKCNFSCYFHENEKFIPNLK